jgi:hypothetical protein
VPYEFVLIGGGPTQNPGVRSISFKSPSSNVHTTDKALASMLATRLPSGSFDAAGW